MNVCAVRMINERYKGNNPFSLVFPQMPHEPRVMTEEYADRLRAQNLTPIPIGAAMKHGPDYVCKHCGSIYPEESK